jgi:phosphoglycolate phosphatase
MKTTHYLFDLDGTITESAPGIIASIKYAKEKLGLNEPRSPNDKARAFDYNVFVGPPLLESFMKYFSIDEAQGREAMTAYREYYANRGIFENAVYPRVSETLARLAGAGKRLSIATSKPTQYAERIIEHFGLAEFFEYINGSDMGEKNAKKGDVIHSALARYPGIDRSAFLMIGDRREDIVGAKENALASCGALWGYGSKAELVEAGADFLASDISELGEIS